MFDSSFNTKQQGNVGIGSAIAYFTMQKAVVCLPLNDSQDYDLIVDINGTLYKVQVKTTRHRAPSGSYAATLKSSGGTSGVVTGNVASSGADLLFILTQSGTRYLLPREVFSLVKSEITLGDKYKDYIV
jgi:hypothetical protein